MSGTDEMIVKFIIGYYREKLFYPKIGRAHV